MEPVFLATTALEEFWDTSKPMVFLGEWCKRFGRKSVWQGLDAPVIADPWGAGRKADEDRQQVDVLCERILFHLGGALNRLHDTHHGSRYWRIMLGPWLWDYISALFVYAATLEAAKNRFPKFSTILLSEESSFVPRDMMEVNWACTEDAYNLQMFSKILSFQGGDFPRKPMQIRVTYPGVYNPTALKRPPWKKVGERLVRMVERTTRNLPRVVLANSCFSNADLLQLFLRSHGTVWPLFLELADYPHLHIQHDARRGLMGDFPAASGFERLLAHILPTDIPQTLVEGYHYICDLSAARFPRRPKAIFSANAWHCHDDFKHWAALHSENGVPLIGTQHGGNYGSLADHLCERHEIGIVDRFYSWGWNGSSTKRVKPFVSTRLKAANGIGTDPDEAAILYGTTCIPRYQFLRNALSSGNFAEYFSWQSQFFKSLPATLRSRIRLRSHCVDYGWDVAERWHEIASDIPVENWEIPFLKSLERCRIYVCDNLSTTFVESLTAEKPTILFWNMDAEPLRPEAQPFYDALSSVGILHHSPEATAAHLSRVYDDVSSWWDAPECRKVRQEFCHQFARTTPTTIQEWAKELRCL